MAAERETTPDDLEMQEGGTLPSVPGTENTRPWACTLFDPAYGIFSEEDLKALSGANCSVLDGCKKPPTLWSIIQHIRQLMRLVRQLFGSDSFQVISGSGSRGRQIGSYVDELWELIANPNMDVDMGMPHKAEAGGGDADGDGNQAKGPAPASLLDEIYHVPLWGLMNTVRRADEEKGIKYHCPLTTCRDFGPLAASDGVRRPYRSHQNLVMHVNECMEILDHEYAATGGLLSLLPTEAEEDAEQLEGARNTIFGQWLLYTQHLVARMHELELNYANALDVLSGEAVVPHQMLSRVPASARSAGRGIVFPQDKFVLANCGGSGSGSHGFDGEGEGKGKGKGKEEQDIGQGGDDDDCVARKIHQLLDRAEASQGVAEQAYWESGVSGERMWKKDRSGQHYSRGLVSVDLVTRYYRLKDQGRESTIFVLPAIEHHPGVRRTRELERLPTVVSVVTPRWPERVSDLEERLAGPLRGMKDAEDRVRALEREGVELRERLGLLGAQLERVTAEVRFYEGSGGGGGSGKDEGEGGSGWGGSRDEMVKALKAYRDKMERLRAVLPGKYHGELEM